MPVASDPRQPPAPAWFSTEAGRILLESQQPALASALCAHPAGTWLWLAADDADVGLQHVLGGRGLRLQLRNGRFEGDLRCALPLPLASESLGCVVLQHVGEGVGAGRAALLEECARVLLPGGVLAVIALNPASPYRLRWQGQGVSGTEPVTWRRRLRRVGLAPEAVALGIGPRWQMQVDPRPQEGAGLRAVYLVRARKQVAALTPTRALRIGHAAAVPGA